METFSGTDVASPTPYAVERARRTELDERQHALAALAASQRGVVSRRQLRGLGFSDGQIAERCRRGLLHRVGPSVFAVGHTGLSRHGRALAALLQAGPEAGLSNDTAARLWGMKSRSADGPIHIAVRTRSSIEVPEGVVLHRPRKLGSDELVVHRGLRVTTPERTILDSLRTDEVVDLTRMLEQMVTVLGRSPDDLHRWGHSVPRRPGRAKLWTALDWIAGPAVIRSEFEELFRSVCQDAGLPIAETNQRVGRWELDALWRLQRVAVELDSWRFHGGRWQFHQDRRKGLAISKAGYELIRLSWWQLKQERGDVVDALRYALARGEQRAAAGIR